MPNENARSPDPGSWSVRSPVRAPAPSPHPVQAFARPRRGWADRARIVAIPACNEAEHIVPCLRALAGQTGLAPHRVVLWANNTTDETCARAEALRPGLPFELRVARASYAACDAHAGRARHDALAWAAGDAPDDAVLLTTDADGEVAPDWLARTLEAFARHDVAAVFGRALLRPEEALRIPQHLHDDDAAEQAYGLLLERITTLIDPDPADPWPRHAENSGASIAVTRSALLAVGGIPPVAHGEDRALCAALRAAGFAVRHEPSVAVFVSARLVGRARGGMAETIARRIALQDPCLDDDLVPVSEHLRRVRGGRATSVGGVAVRRCDLARHRARAERVLAFLTRRPGWAASCLGELEAVDPV